MGALPIAVVLAELEEETELVAARAWAERGGVELEWDSAELRLRVPMTSVLGEAYLLEGRLDDYPALPPAWVFLDPRTGLEVGKAGYPLGVSSSVMHGNGCICAPWNRLAYAVCGGPHPDWGEFGDWRRPRPPYTHACAIPDMLDRISREVRSSPGRMAPLPVEPT